MAEYRVSNSVTPVLDWYKDYNCQTTTSQAIGICTLNQISLSKVGMLRAVEIQRVSAQETSIIVSTSIGLEP